MTSDGYNCSDFPAHQLNKFRASTAELILVQTYIAVCHVTTQHYNCVYDRYSTSISTRLEYLLLL